MTERKTPPPMPESKRVDDTFGNRHVKTDTGGMVFIPKEMGMQRAIITPCAECPLRKDSVPGYLGGYSPEMYIGIMRSPASIACHSSKGFHEGRIHEQRHCTGVAAWRANTGWQCQHQGVPTAAHDSTRFVGPDSRFFEDAESFINHHKPGQKAR